MAKEKRTIDDLTLWDDAKRMIKKAETDGVETVWDRLEEQTPHCMFCENGLTCSKCVMGPCRISAKGTRRSAACAVPTPTDRGPQLRPLRGRGGRIPFGPRARPAWKPCWPWAEEKPRTTGFATRPS
jgi:hypothetical protein